MPGRHSGSPQPGSDGPGQTGRSPVPGTSRSRKRLLWTVGGVSLLLAAVLRSPEIPVESPPEPGPPAGEPPRPGLLAAALLLCATLALGAVVARQVSQTRENDRVARALTGGEPRRAPDLVTRYGCGGCHTIPGLPAADGKVAAPLVDMR